MSFRSGYILLSSAALSSRDDPDYFLSVSSLIICLMISSSISFKVLELDAFSMGSDEDYDYDL